MHCTDCGKEIADGSTFCPECGAKLSAPGPAQQKPDTVAGTRDQVNRENVVYPKNPPLSPHLAWLSLILTGLPQLIFGQVAKGIVCCAVFFLSLPTGILPLPILIAASIDAYMVGKILQSGKPVTRWQFFPN